MSLLLLFSACVTPLQKAAWKGQRDRVANLLAQGADIEGASRGGVTPLMWAAAFGREETVKLLLDKGANINASDVRRRTALWYAATNGNLELIKLLRERGAEISFVDNLGQTPRESAADNGYLDVAQYLAQADVRLSSADLQHVVADAVNRAAFDRLSSKPAKNSDVDLPKYQLPVRPNDYALIIGIEKYKSVRDADYVARDAEAVRRHVEALGFPRQNIIYLVGPNATRAAMSSYIEEWLPRNVKQDSTVLFYFAGHGTPDIESGQTYLAPWDGDPTFLKSSTYPTKHLYEQFGKLNIKRSLIVLDACFSGAGGRSVLPRGSRPLVGRLETEIVPRNATLLAAAGADQITGALEEQGHGIFTYYFLKGLAGAAKDAEGNLTPDGLYWYLKPLVQAEAKRQNRDQAPILEGLARNQVFVKWPDKTIGHRP